MLLEDRIAFVTGGAGRLGGAIAEVLLREGAHVILADRNGPAVKVRAEELDGTAGRKVVAVAGDVSKKDDVARMVDESASALGLADVVVNAHGIFPNCPVLDVEPDAWDEVFAVNVRGSMLTIQAHARRWIEAGTRGAVVNISSGAARSARAGGAHYTGSKAAVNMMTEVMAIEFGPHGIRVNAVAPGLIMDDVVTEASADRHPYVNMMLQGTPLRRTGTGNDIAEAVAFLASARSGWTTGAVLEITGGSHCGRTHMPLTQNLR